MLAQRTIRNKTSATGVGLHTGKKAVLTLHPADPDTGIIFRRIDGDKVIEMPAGISMTLSPSIRLKIIPVSGSAGCKVSTAFLPV